MFRIRLHGRGGQGIKTGGQVLGTAFFLEGYEVQDAPRYGAERRGAPISSGVRADRSPIHERGVIAAPDLVVVADETLIPVPAAGVLQGASSGTLLVVAAASETADWGARVGWPGPVVSMPAANNGAPVNGTVCAAAAAALVGRIRRDTLLEAVRRELPDGGTEADLASAAAAFDAMAPHAGLVGEGAGQAGPASAAPAPDWIDLPLDDATLAAPVVSAGPNSARSQTGLWRTARPEIDRERCHRCSWICSTFCPDSAITVGPDRSPHIDLDHCKGCMVCVAVCPTHAIAIVPERGGHR